MYQPGDFVRSVAVGRRAAFDGVVVGPYYETADFRVEDQNGRQWVRSIDELSRCPIPASSEAKD